MKVKITVEHTETSTVDIGTLPLGMFKAMVGDEAQFDGNWSVGDLPGNEWKTTSVLIEELPPKSK